MGYRNDVKICMKKENFEAMIQQGKEQLQDQYLFEPVSMMVHERKNGTVILSWFWTKWDSELEDVAFVMNFLDRMQEEGYPYSFCRIGEDFGDMEERIFKGLYDEDDSCDCIRLVREFEVDDEDE